jgi:thiamine pyrophosphate-dependent acetolactate synthase large subunit-like protein
MSKTLSRRGFVNRLVKTGVTLAAAQSVVQSLTPMVYGETGEADVAPEDVRIFEGSAGEAFAEQLIASGVKYVFGNSASADAHFYEALVDRPELTYILTPHEGPGAAMAMGYIQASGEPAIVMQAAIVGLCNAMGQMYNAWKEQTPLVYYSYRAESSRSAGRDGFEEVMYQEEMVAPITKWHWLARRPDMIPETIRRSFKVAWTPPYGPTYATWHADYTKEKVRTEVISHKMVDPRMRIRPNPREVERAARMLVEAEKPMLYVGDELYKTNSVDKAVKLAEALGMIVSQPRQVFSNFPESHHLYESSRGNLRTHNPDLVMNVGNKLQHNRPNPLVPRSIKFIDMRNDAASMGNVITVDVPLVADVGHGLDDLLAALEDVMTPSLKKKAQERTDKIRALTDRNRKLRNVMMKNPDWDRSPLLSDRLTYEITQFADKDAIIVDESGGTGGKQFFDFNPMGGREHIAFYAGHLGGATGKAAGVKMARPNQQVIALTGDGAFIFGPTGLWNMARLGLPVLVVVYNNHAYGGPHNRVINSVADSRMAQESRFFIDYLGKPDMNMAEIASGFGVDGEQVESPGQLQEALKRGRRANDSGKPYLIDAQVARTGVGWSEDPWVPQLA